MQKWLAKAAGHAVERLECPHSSRSVNLSAPRKGILHTTEGSFESALGVFRQHYAPHFMVGRDKAGRVRILQLVPLGTMASSLENHPGGVETNSVCVVQVEIVGHSKTTPWLPDQEVTAALAALMAELRHVAGIPLVRAVNPGRSATRWPSLAGWLGHADVPENSHWDPGALSYYTLLALAMTIEPDPPPPAKLPSGFLAWWGWRALKLPQSMRPNVPARIPASWWTLVKRLKGAK